MRHVQVVLRIYRSPAEIALGFDVDCCSVVRNSDFFSLHGDLSLHCSTLPVTIKLKLHHKPSSISNTALILTSLTSRPALPPFLAYPLLYLAKPFPLSKRIELAIRW